MEEDFLSELEDMKLTDLLSVEELQLAETAFSKMARMATLITDENGIPITTGSHFSRFCTDFCRATPEGRKRCEACDKMGAIAALEQQKAIYYFCHANLVDFAAPIMLHGKMIGSFIGGQVLSSSPNLEAMRKTAQEIGVDEEEFLKAAQETNVVPVAAIERCTNFIYEFSKILSSMALKSYEAKKEGQIALQAATAKTDFLANMSHEIRTPMNAILGMSQIALREEMSKKARDYISQVRSSAEMLLTIINDILDYSKLEAGKMSIIPVEYSPINLVKEVGSIILNRIGNKNIEFVIDMDPAIPCELKGDDVRIKQMLVNLANNAVKFTENGQVRLSVRCKEIGNNKIMMTCAVADTGMGIKKEDIGKLFNSFEQVDSKRNRKVEGTGLGLAIVKELVESMNGSVSVESEYGVGSTFTFQIEQEVVNPVRSVEYLTDCPCVLGIIGNEHIAKQLEKDMATLGAQYVATLETQLDSVLAEVESAYLFVEERYMTDEIVNAVRKYPTTKLVIICSHNGMKKQYAEDIIVMRKPIAIFTTAAILMNKSGETQSVSEVAEVECDFKAPEAKVLIVDDNEVNLSVAEGLLEPLEMQLDKAESGMRAIEKVAEKRYDIVFMDHMMPEMDGVEATKEIRKRYPEYKKVPIIALTANALVGNREMFFNAGMDDFVAKPIELKDMLVVLKKWLPTEKIVALNEQERMQQAAKNVNTDEGIGGMTFLDTGYALSLLKSEKLYWKILKDYYQMIDKKIAKIKQSEVEEDIGIYIVEVHALKSSSKQIGALSLSKKAENLEAAGNHHDLEKIHTLTDEMLEEYRNLETSLSPYFMETEEEQPIAESTGKVADKSQISEFLQKVKNAIDDLDLDAAEEAAGELAGIGLASEMAVICKELKTAISDMDLDHCADLIEQLENMI